MAVSTDLDKHITGYYEDRQRKDPNFFKKHFLGEFKTQGETAHQRARRKLEEIDEELSKSPSRDRDIIPLVKEKEMLIQWLKDNPENSKQKSQYKHKFEYDDAADAMSYASAAFTNTKIYKKDSDQGELVNFYSKFKNFLPPKTWKELVEGESVIHVSYDSMNGIYAVRIHNKNEYTFNEFKITDVELIEESEKVANKFLPFIVESSTPLNIFKTLLQRSKGMNRVLIASIFNATLAVDIKKLRKIAKDLPDMPLENVYEEIMTKYQQFRITDVHLDIFENLRLFLPDDVDLWTEDLTQFDVKDVMMFFAVLSTHKDLLKQYSDIPWDEIVDVDEVFEDLPKHIQLSDNADPIEVKSNEELKSFILYVVKLWPAIHKDPPPPFCVKFHQVAAES